MNNVGLGINIDPTSGQVKGDVTQQIAVNFTTSLYKYASTFECLIIADATPTTNAVVPIYMELISGKNY